MRAIPFESSPLKISTIREGGATHPLPEILTQAPRAGFPLTEISLHCTALKCIRAIHAIVTRLLGNDNDIGVRRCSSKRSDELEPLPCLNLCMTELSDCCGSLRCHRRSQETLQDLIDIISIRSCSPRTALVRRCAAEVPQRLSRTPDFRPRTSAKPWVTTSDSQFGSNKYITRAASELCLENERQSSSSSV